MRYVSLSHLRICDSNHMSVVELAVGFSNDNFNSYTEQKSVREYTNDSLGLIQTCHYIQIFTPCNLAKYITFFLMPKGLPYCFFFIHTEISP